MRLALLAVLLVASPVAGFPTHDDGGDPCVRILGSAPNTSRLIGPVTNSSDSTDLMLGPARMTMVTANGSVEIVFDIASAGDTNCADISPTFRIFGTDVGPSADPSIPLAIQSLVVKVVSPTDAIVFWTTSSPTVGRVVWGKVDEAPSAVVDSDAAYSLSHQATLTGLVPGGSYRFYVLASDSRGNVIHSSDTDLLIPTLPRDLGAEIAFIVASTFATVGVACALWRKRR